MQTLCPEAIEAGYLNLASGGTYARAEDRVASHKAVLRFWHASTAKNTAAQFAIRKEMDRGALLDLWLCNLDCDNVFLECFPAHVMNAAGFVSRALMKIVWISCNNNMQCQLQTGKVQEELRLPHVRVFRPALSTHVSAATTGRIVSRPQ